MTLFFGILAVLLALALGIGGSFFYEQRKQLQKLQIAFRKFEGIADLDEHREKLEARLKHLKAILPRYESIIEMQEHKSQLEAQIVELKHEDADWRQRIAEYGAVLTEMQGQMASVEETLDLQSYGFYRPRYGFEDSAHYSREIDRIRTQQKELIKAENATQCETKWTVDGSQTKGRKMMKQQSKLMLRAFNGECDAAVAKVKFSNVTSLENRIKKSFEAVNKLGESKHIWLTHEYLNLKLEELYLVYEHRKQVEAEREEQREIREQMREEERALQEIEKAKREAEQEEEIKSKALEKARKELADAHGLQTDRLQGIVDRLESELKEALERKARAIARAQLTKSGHVYVLSNIGSFGENVYKIGMTRRLDPQERVYELGGASVPFRFDVHAMIYTKDAPALENTLHHHFDSRRVNMVNARREFFRVTLDEIREAVEEHHGFITFTMSAEAQEYRETVAMQREAHQLDIDRNSSGRAVAK